MSKRAFPLSARVATLLGINLALAAVGIWALRHARQDDRLLSTPAEKRELPTSRLNFARPLLDAVNIQERPLFYTARSFYVPKEPSNADAVARPDYKLAGVLVFPGKPAIALLVQSGSNASRKVKAGDELDGWVVKTIDRARVVLGHGAEQFELLAAQNQGVSMGFQKVTQTSQVVTPAQGIKTLGSATPVGSMSKRESEQARLYRPPP